MGVVFSGCSLVSTVNEEDMKQVIATVDISQSENLETEGLSAYASAITSTEILKRDLVSAFVNVGYYYVQNGSTYSDVFTTLVDSLTSTAVVTQYVTMYMIKEKEKTDSSALTLFTDENLTEAEKYEYLLGGEDSADVLYAKYSVYSSINSSLDSIEESYLDGDDDTSGTDTRTTPSNVDTLQEKYYPKNADGSLNYGIYTGYDGYLLDSSWDYESLDGTNRNTRRKAYNSFISTLQSNYLITDDDKNITDVWNLTYVQEEYVSSLKQILIDNFYDIFEEQQEAIIKQTDENGEYSYLKYAYEKLLNDQAISYSDVSSFETAMDEIADTSFILYSPATSADTEGGSGTFGFVYNILLPFSTTQSNRLSELSSYLSSGAIDDNQYYAARNLLLKEITTTDQRSAWFNGETDYSFDASESGLSYYTGGNDGRKYLFFENNMLYSESKYEKLERYAGLYSYNGTVTENEDGTYGLSANKLDIDGMLEEFVGYVNFILDGTGASASYEKSSGYYDTVDFYKEGSSKDIDYSKFVYATGKVNFEANKNDMYEASAAQYLAMSAVNELQYAYTTDTGVLSKFIGYSVSAYSTSFIKEFEYAAQNAVKNGAGSFAVCAGDYGWHLIYVTDTFSPEGGEAYSPSWTEERIDAEGTFENKFYEWIKDSPLSDVTTVKRSLIIQLFGGDTTVTLYEKTYQDLLDLDN